MIRNVRNTCYRRWRPMAIRSDLWAGSQVRLRLRQATCKRNEEDGRRLLPLCARTRRFSVLSCFSFGRVEVLEKKQPQLWKGNRLEIYTIKGHEYKPQRFVDLQRWPEIISSDTYGDFPVSNRCESWKFPRYAGFGAVLPNTFPLLKLRMGGWFLGSIYSFDMSILTAHEARSPVWDIRSRQTIPGRELNCWAFSLNYLP